MTVTTSDLRGHSPVASLFTWDFRMHRVHCCSTVNKTSTDIDEFAVKSLSF